MKCFSQIYVALYISICQLFGVLISKVHYIIFLYIWDVLLMQEVFSLVFFFKESNQLLGVDTVKFTLVLMIL